jgi:hypothetical protein
MHLLRRKVRWKVLKFDARRLFRKCRVEAVKFLWQAMSVEQLERGSGSFALVNAKDV